MDLQAFVENLPKPRKGVVRVLRVEAKHEPLIGGIDAVPGICGQWSGLPTPYQDGYLGLMYGRVCAALPSQFHRWFPDIREIDTFNYHCVCLDVSADSIWIGNMQVVIRRDEAELVAVVYG